MTRVDEPRPRLTDLDVHPDALLAVLQRADLRGHGGGAFPTATKIASARGRRPRLVINACDGEPLVAKDAALLTRAPGVVIDGAALIARAVGAREVVLAAHQGSAALESAHRIVVEAGARWPGSRVVAVPPRYVASEASALASLVAGGPAQPFTRDRPLSERGPGRGGVAVLVLNAETVARVAGWWADHLSGTPIAPHRLVTVTGEVVAPGVREVPTSSTLADVVVAAGGATAAPRSVLFGGYAGTWLDWAADRDRRLDSPDLGAGLVHVVARSCPLTVVNAALAYLAAESAGQCGPCMFGLPAVSADWAELGDPQRGPASCERLRRRLPLLEGRGACHHPDGATRMATSALRLFAAHVEEHWRGGCTAGRSIAYAGGWSR